MDVKTNQAMSTENAPKLNLEEKKQMSLQTKLTNIFSSPRDQQKFLNFKGISTIEVQC